MFVSGAPQCVVSYRIVDAVHAEFIITPGVVNCFSCALEIESNIEWEVEDGARILRVIPGAPLALAGGTTIEVEGNILILPMPELFVLPGNSGQMDIVCRSDSGQRYNATLNSPSRSDAE